MKWTAEDDRELADAVARHGYKWRSIATSFAGRRSASSVRLRWYEIASTVDQTDRLSIDGVTNVARTHQGSRSSRNARWIPYVLPKRDRKGGRPWEYYVKRGVCGSRAPTDRQSTLLRLWCLDSPEDRIFMSNLQRAEGIGRRHLISRGVDPDDANDAMLCTQLSRAERDALGLLYWPGDTIHTMTSSNSNLYWICGPMGRLGFATTDEVASFMGHSRRGAIPAARRAGHGDYKINAWSASSVPARMATHCAQMATQAFLQHGRWLVGSLFSGPFDALAEGFVSCGADTERVFAAESDEEKAAVLHETKGCFVYDSAERAAVECPNVDALLASPPCDEVSTAGSGGECSDTRTHIETICTTVRRACPLAVIIEQSDGMRTHHPDIYAYMRRSLNKLPYMWRHASVDAHDDYGASHFRKRLLWVGTRLAD